MKPAQPGASIIRFARRLWLAAVVALVGGCSQDSINLQSPEDDFDLLESNVKLVGDYAVADGVHPVKINGVALVTQLDGTGSDPAMSDFRNLLVTEMQTRGVKQPNQVLASDKTAMVMVTAYLRPGIRKGDHFDIMLECQDDDATTSLRGGWLLETRLKQMFRTADEVIRDGEMLGLAQGWVLVDPRDEEQDPDALRKARVLGGGVATQSRELSLLIRDSSRSLDHSRRTARSATLGKAINNRFSIYKQGVQEGVANPKTDELIELQVHPRLQRQSRPLHRGGAFDRGSRKRRRAGVADAAARTPVARSDHVGPRRRFSSRRSASRGSTCSTRASRRTIKKSASIPPKRSPISTTKPRPRSWQKLLTRNRPSGPMP